MPTADHPILRRIPLFRDFSDSECEALLAVARRRTIPVGDVVFAQGSVGHTMVVVLDGRLKAQMQDSKGNATELGAIQQGEIVGEMAALDPAPRAATVIAASDAEVLELDAAGLQRLRTTAPAACGAIVSAIIGDVTRRLRQTNQRIDRELHPTGTPAPAAAPGRHRPSPHGAERQGSGAFEAAASNPSGSLLSRIWARLTGD